MITIAILALATASVSMTLSKAQIFAGLRKWLLDGCWLRVWVGELLSCPYCTSHWVALVLVLAYRPILVQAWLPLDLAVAVFVIVTLAAPLQWVIFKVFAAMMDRETST